MCGGPTPTARSASWWPAVAGYINPSTGQLHNAERSNLGTFIGALCFLAGALLLLPERTEDASAPVTTPAAADT